MAPEVLAATIETSGTIIATIIAAIVAGGIGKVLTKQQRTKDDLELAMNDIEFLLEVERAHGECHRESCGQPKTKIIRKQVKNDLGLRWSGEFVPSKARNYKS